MVHDYFRLGRIGMLVVAIIAPIYTTLYFMAWMGLLTLGPMVPLVLVLFALSIGLYIGFVVSGMGFLGFSKTMNLKWGQVGLLFPILFGWAFLSAEIYQVVLLYLNALYQTLRLYLAWLLPSWLLSPIFAEIFIWVLKFGFFVCFSFIWSWLLFQAESVTKQPRRTFLTAWLFLATGLTFVPLLLTGSILSFYIAIPIFAAGGLLLCLSSILNGLIFRNFEDQKSDF
ncbi:MAG: hypothetical protein ACFFCH_10575 [Promethearchaeota archaeon]